jgi:hypothetical protein
MTLDKMLRDSLKKQSWLEATRYRRNKYEVKSDYEKYIKRDLRDLAILASKIPDDMLDETFTPDSINELVAAIFNRRERRKRIEELANRVNQLREPINKIESKLNDKRLKLSPEKRNRLQEERKQLDEKIPWRQVDDELRKLIRSIDERRAKIAKVLIDHGIRYLIDQYVNVEEELPIRKRITNSMLEAEELASSIVNKVIAAQVESNNNRKS